MLVHAPSGSLLLRVRDPSTVKQHLPPGATKDISYEGHNVAVRHTLDTVRVLRNLGISAPSPIEYQYKWPGRFTPFDHQRATSAFMTLTKRGFILNEQGTCKTASAIWAADYLMTVGAIRKCLIVAPLSTLESVWQEDLFSTAMHRKGVILHAPNRDRRVELLKQDFDFYIINHDGIKLIGAEIAARGDIDLIIVDEATCLKNSKTALYSALEALIKPQTWLWLMTGTPCAQAPTDAWALAKLVSPERVPRFFGPFREKTMMRISQYKWVPRIGAHTIVYDALQPAIRFRKSECLDLPSMTFETRYVELSAEQVKAFKQMRKDMLMEIEADRRLGVILNKPNPTLTAINAADKINKLRQILCGVVRKPGQDEFVVLDHANRVQVTLECIDGTEAKVIVVVPFKGIIQTLAEEIRAAGHTVEVMNGDVTRTQRADIVRRFQTDPSLRVLLCHPKVMAHGLTLTEADTLVFYAPIYSNEQYLQVIERINRPGQTRKMTIIKLVAHGLEKEIYQAVEALRMTQQAVLDLYDHHVLKGE